jgi:hypothetical protein
MEKMQTNRQQFRPARADLRLGTTSQKSETGVRHGQSRRLRSGAGEGARSDLPRHEIAATGSASVGTPRVVRGSRAPIAIVVTGRLVMLPREGRQGSVALPTRVRMVPTAAQHRVGRQQGCSEVGK